jgi:hypothetical protein
LKFSLWMERKGASEAILGALGVEPEERSGALGRKTTYFGSEVRSKLKNLGVVKGTNDDQGSYGDIVRSIDDGITVRDLIKRVSG